MAEQESVDVVTVCVDGEEFEWNKVELQGVSSYFDAMFSCAMKESLEGSVTLQDVSAKTFRVLYSYAKGEHLLINQDNVLEVLAIASMLQFGEAVKECSEFLSQDINEKTCLRTMQAADLHSLSALYNHARKIALWEFKHVCKCQGFLDLDLDTLQNYLMDSMLNVDCEIQVFRAAVHWAEANLETRIHDFHNLLIAALRFASLSKNDAMEMLECDVFRKCAKDKEIFTALDKYANSLPDQECQDPLKNNCFDIFSKKASRKVPRAIWAVGGTLTEQTHGDPSEHDREKEEINKFVLQCNLQSAVGVEQITRLPYVDNDTKQEQFWGCKACVIDRYLYILGGQGRTGMKERWLTEVWCYDVFMDQWQMAGTMQSPRRHHTLVTWGNRIYVIGGFGRHRILQSSVDAFDVDTRIWKSMPSLHEAVYSAAACVCQDRIYVIKSSIETWAPGENIWTRVNIPIPFEIGIHNAATINNKIYLTGTHMNYIHVLDPAKRSCEKCGKWAEASGATCVIDGQLYVVGGEECSLIERCIPRNDCAIETVGNLCHSIKDHCVVVLPNYPDFV